MSKKTPSYPIINSAKTFEWAYDYACRLSFKAFWWRGGLYLTGAYELDQSGRPIDDAVTGWGHIPQALLK